MDSIMGHSDTAEGVSFVALSITTSGVRQGCVAIEQVAVLVDLFAVSLQQSRRSVKFWHSYASPAVDRPAGIPREIQKPH
jgi:hypothetical protein